MAYRFWRVALRLWFALIYRRIRVLHEERLEGAVPALLVVSRPASFLDALMVTAGLERQVRCLLPAGLILSRFQRYVAQGLGIISFLPDTRQDALEKCFAVLAEKGVVATFIEPLSAQSGGASEFETAASIAVEAESRHADGLGVVLFPVHLYLPLDRRSKRELLIDIDHGEAAQEYVVRAGGARIDQVEELAKPLESRCRENSFRLLPDDLKDFLSDLKQALCDDLQEQSSPHSARRQNPESFDLSRFVVQWAEQMNYLHPGLVVSLRESVKAWREARRRAALHQVEVERAGGWIKRPLGRAIAWSESLVGFFVATYGLINHLLALAVLYLTGLSKRDETRDEVTLWLWRGLTLLGCYAVQVLLVAHAWGRRAAGYYAPSLPLSALYAWRYVSVVRPRARIVFLSLNLSAETARSKRLRRNLLAKVDQALNRHAEMLALPH